MTGVRARWPAAIAGSVLLLAVLAGTASARAVVPQLSVAPTSGPPGTRIVVHGIGFCAPPCSPVEVDFAGAVVAPAVRVGVKGSFRVTITVPASAPGGVNTVYAQQRDTTATDRQARTTFRITPSTPQQQGAPARTRAPTASPTTSAPRPNAGAPTSGRPSAATPTRVAHSPGASTPTAPAAGNRPASGSDGSTWWYVGGGLALAALVASGAWLWLRHRAPN